MIAPSRRLLLSCLLLLAASLLVSLWGLGSGQVPLSVEQVLSALLGDAPRNITI
jgi:ABC-type enterobactin transport system, permease component